VVIAMTGPQNTISRKAYACFHALKSLELVTQAVPDRSCIHASCHLTEVRFMVWRTGQ
jgi:hypothetical protein